MLDILFWIIIGALSGWVGYLATRGEKSKSLGTMVAVGIFGGVLGGVLMRIFGLAGDAYAVNIETVFPAMLISALFVTICAAVSNFLGSARAN